VNQATRFVATAVLVAGLGVGGLGGCRRRETAARGPAVPAPPVEDADVARRSGAARSGSGPAVIWLGLDGLDWEILDRLSGSGEMPNWTRLVAEGWSGRLAASPPLLSPILWTTEATGVPPDVHRVLDFQETDPATGRKVPISGASRAVPAVWNLASAAGEKVGVVGWWATHPAEEVNGFFVSDRASPLLFESPSLAGVAYPPDLESGVAQVIARDGAVRAEDLARFVNVPPGEVAKALAEGGGGRSRHPVAGLARLLGATRVSHRIARDLYDRDRPDLLALYLEGTDEVGHIFAPHTAPKLPCASDDDVARYGNAVPRYYSLVDSLLGQWMRRAREDGATLLVTSDHGFKWGPDRPCGFAAGNWATAAFWHKPDGVMAAWGSRVRPSAARGSATVLDLAPSILALLGLPSDHRMPGNVLAAAFAGLPPGSRQDVFSGVVVRRVSAAVASQAESDEYVRKLIALGYLSPSDARPLAAPGGVRPGMTEGAWNNLGVYLRDARRDLRGARQAFERSLALRPDYYSALFNMAVLDRSRGDDESAIRWLFRSVNAVGGDPAPAIVEWARESEKLGRPAAAVRALRKARGAWPANEDIARALAMALYRAGECRSGVVELSPFETRSVHPATLNALALLQTCLENRPEVVRLLRRSLELDPNQPEVARSLRIAEGT
jgi:predicted AlkP superfamily phosphohydrolase/phosphomutase/tetratricopeptide (TPR) repeat protein